MFNSAFKRLYSKLKSIARDFGINEEALMMAVVVNSLQMLHNSGWCLSLCGHSCGGVGMWGSPQQEGGWVCHVAPPCALRRARWPGCLTLHIIPVQSGQTYYLSSQERLCLLCQQHNCSGQTCFKELTKGDWMWIFAVAFSVVVAIIKIIVIQRLKVTI